MVRHIFRPSGKLFLSALVTLGMACFSASAYAAAANVVAGCNADVWNALEAKAEAQVAYDSAVTRQMINKPDSVLTLTCFSNAAGVSAKDGGAIFSGDFTTQLQTIMTVTAPPFNCNEIGTLWNTIATAGVQTGAPYATFNDLLTGTAPVSANGTAAGADFTAGWTAATTAQVFQNLNTAVAALPVPPKALNFAAAKSSCDVLLIAGIIPGPCP